MDNESDNPFERMIRDLIERPESPQSLSLQSHIEEIMRPSSEALQGLIEAIAVDLNESNELSRTAVAAARRTYERVTGNTAVDGLWNDLVEDARKLNFTRQTHPPAMRIILDIDSEPSDLEYTIAGTLGGLRGTWHRLWASISSERWLASQGAAPASIVEELRREFEGMFGRAISSGEWERLVEHAHRHCDEVLLPSLAKFGSLATDHTKKDDQNQHQDFPPRTE